MPLSDTFPFSPQPPVPLTPCASHDHCVPVPLGSSSPAMTARDHRHQAAAARFSLPGHACLSETWADYRRSQAAEPNLICARKQDYLPPISARGMATLACAPCSYGQASDASPVKQPSTGQGRGPCSAGCCIDRCYSREVLRAATHTGSMRR